MFNTTRRCRIYMVLMLALLGSVTMVTPVFAAGITVTTVDDEDGTGADCSLREAIEAANTDAAYGGCSAGSGSDTITLPVGIYTLTLGDQLPAVTTTIVIDGNGSTIQADASPNTATYRVFEVTGGGDLTLNDLAIQHGHCENSSSCTSQSDPPNDRGNGGGIFNEGILTLSNVTVTNNSADNSGGGIYHKAGTLNLLGGIFLENVANSDGGGIASGGSGSMTVTNAIFRSNQAGNSGGGISSSGSTLDVTGSIFETNNSGGSGGAIIGGGNVHVKTSAFDGNSADRGGAIFNGGGTDSSVSNSTFYSNTASSNGGGIYNYEDLAVTNSTFNLNSASNNGGAFYSDPYQHENNSIYAVVSLTNTILANSISGGDCFNYVNGLKVDITGSNNLIQTDSAAPNACETTAPINNTDPQLGTLTGSPLPQYYPLLPGSPAIDAGDDITCAAPPVSNTSQNGVTRPQGLHCDIGAYELKTDTTTALTSAPNPSMVGELVVFTATVTAGIGTPTGTVTFTEGITTLGSGPLDAGGQVTLPTSALSAGTHVITATYGGDDNFGASTSDVVTQTVLATTTTALTSSPNPSVVGELVVFTATVAGPGGPPTGTVTFCEFDAISCVPVDTIPLVDGVATFSTSALTVGDHSFRADYSGDANFNASTSDVVPQSVNKADTTTAFTSAPNPSVVGELVVFTATVTAGIGTPTGTVTFTEGITTLGSGPLDASGQVTLSTGALSAGTHVITATYSGDANFGASTSDEVTQTVTATGATTTTTTALTSAPNPSVVGELVVFTATVTAESGTSAVSATFAESSATPTGSVTFTDGGATLGTVPLNNGVATFSTSNLSAAAHTISATYSGDANFGASTSVAVTQSVTVADTTKNVFLPLITR